MARRKSLSIVLKGSNTWGIQTEPENLSGEQRPDGTVHKRHRGVIGYGNYLNKITIDGKEYYVRFTVQRKKNESGVHSSFVSSVELYDNPAAVAYGPSHGRGRLDYDRITDAKLKLYFEKSKENDEKVSEIFNVLKGSNTWGIQTAQTDAGKAKQASNAFGDMQENVGSLLSPVRTLLERVSQFGFAALGLVKLWQALKGVVVWMKAATLSSGLFAKALTWVKFGVLKGSNTWGIQTKNEEN